MASNVIFRGYSELRPFEREMILRAFKNDYQGYNFQRKYKINRDCWRKLKEESKNFIL